MSGARIGLSRCALEFLKALRLIRAFTFRAISGFTYPKGPSTQIVGFQGPKTIQGMDYSGTRTLWVRVEGRHSWVLSALNPKP